MRVYLNALTITLLLTAAVALPAGVTMVLPTAPVDDQFVSVSGFDGDGAISNGTTAGPELGFNGLFLVVEAFDGNGLEVEVATRDANNVFRPLQRFEPGEMIGPTTQFVPRGDVVFEFPQDVPAHMGFRFRRVGESSYCYGWVRFHWTTKTIANLQFEFMLVHSAAWSDVPGTSIPAGSIIQTVPVSQPIFTENSFRLSAETVSGVSYSLQRKDAFSPNSSWLSVGTLVGAGNREEFVHLAPGMNQGFYRVVID